jgi:hypothetical protein
MSDTYYQQRAARRTRILWIAVGLVAVLACVVAGTMSLFYDACTKSFDRSPRAVVSTFVQAVGEGNAPVAQECWEHNAYYDLNAGCSEICLSRAYGASFQVVDVALGSPAATPEGRTNLTATVSIVCTASGQAHSGQVVLDAVGSSLPWKHWAIVHNTFGGTTAQAWCK